MITVKEEFLTDDKTLRAIEVGGYEVLAMWLAMKRYAAEHPTDGFVPDEDVGKLPGAPRNPRKALRALVVCGRIQRDGRRGPGLVDEVEYGWQLHDYNDHANSQTDEELRREKARAKKAAQRAAKATELERLKRAALRGTVPGTTRGHNGGLSPGQPGDRYEGRPPDSSAGARPAAPACPRDPSPAQPSPARETKAAADDPSLTGQGSEAPSEVRRRLPEDLESALGIPIAERAKTCRDRPDLADWLGLDEWPEVVEATRLLCEAMHLSIPKFGLYRQDSGLRAIVDLLAAGHTLDEFRAAAGAVARDQYLASHRSLSAVTAAVFRRLLSAAHDATAGPVKPVAVDLRDMGPRGVKVGL